jgi:hypothetical protein
MGPSINQVLSTSSEVLRLIGFLAASGRISRGEFGESARAIHRDEAEKSVSGRIMELP